MTMNDNKPLSHDKEPLAVADAWERQRYDPMRASRLSVGLTNQSFYGYQARLKVEEARAKRAAAALQPK